TYKTAKMACGAVIASCRSVLNGEHQNAFALVRGYCHINNVAIAAQVMFEEERASRILIVDWDVHHGNGTQKHFLSNPNCLYFSIHAYHEAQFYPFSTNADLGVSGNGFNINVPWGWKGGGGDSDYIHVFNELLLPVAKEFNPDLVLVSAGFDAALGDVGERGLSPAGYAHMTRLLMDLAGGKVVLSLEQVKQVHRQFWKCFEGCEQPAAARELGFDDTGEGEATPEPSSQIDRKDIENSLYSLSDAVRFYHRCMWITQFALTSSKISMGPDMLEVLYTPVDIENVGENELSNTLYLLLLDGAYSRIDEKIVDGVGGYLHHFTTSNLPFLVLDLPDWYQANQNEAMDTCCQKIWNLMITYVINFKIQYNSRLFVS
ncbi:Histone deacetylase hda1, partial [Chytriomyces hyalinus]